jgi:hypothetical protein
MEERQQFQALVYRASSFFKAPVSTIVDGRKDQIMLIGFIVDEISRLGSFCNIKSELLTGEEAVAKQKSLYKNTRALISRMEKRSSTVREQDFWRFLISDWAYGIRSAAGIYSTYYQLF